MLTLLFNIIMLKFPGSPYPLLLAPIDWEKILLIMASNKIGPGGARALVAKIEHPVPEAEKESPPADVRRAVAVP